MSPRILITRTLCPVQPGRLSTTSNPTVQCLATSHRDISTDSKGDVVLAWGPSWAEVTWHECVSLKLNPPHNWVATVSSEYSILLRCNLPHNKISLQNMLNGPCPKSSFFLPLTRRTPQVTSPGADILHLSVLKSTPVSWSRKSMYSSFSALSGGGYYSAVKSKELCSWQQ